MTCAFWHRYKTSRLEQIENMVTKRWLKQTRSRCLQPSVAHAVQSHGYPTKLAHSTLTTTLPARSQVMHRRSTTSSGHNARKAVGSQFVLDRQPQPPRQPRAIRRSSLVPLASPPAFHAHYATRVGITPPHPRTSSPPRCRTNSNFRIPHDPTACHMARTHPRQPLH